MEAKGLYAGIKEPMMAKGPIEGKRPTEVNFELHGKGP